MREPDYKSITPRRLREKLQAGEQPELLDVREPWEFAAARIEGSTLIPLGEMPGRISELDPGRETVVICHHGARSAYVTRALDRSGFDRVLNLEGGLDAYSRVDETVPRY
ncbi:MAG: rhodanese-like domain-containing protein [Rubrobacteraceae bacterium]